MYLDLLKIKKGYYFLIIAGLSIFFTYYISSVFVSETVYLKTYSETLTEDKIIQLFNLSKSYQLISFGLFPFMLIIKVMYNSMAVTTGTLLENEAAYTFESNFNVCLKAELVFVVMNIAKVLTFVFFKKVDVLGDIGYVPLSLLDLFNRSALQKWEIYPLQTLNIWEVLYCYIGAHLFATTYRIPLKKAIGLFCVPYIIGVLVILLIVSFLTLQVS